MISKDSQKHSQNALKNNYSGADLLLRAKNDLKNYHHWVVEIFLKHASLSRDSKVLDFGCGPGILSEIFFAKTSIKPDGVEIDDNLRKVFCQQGFVGYASLHDTESTYDVILSSNVLEHIEDDKATLRDLRQHLATDGQLMLYVPAFPLIWTKMDEKVGHYRRYRKKDLVEKLEATGYEVNVCHYCDSIGFFLALVFKYLGPGSGEPSSFSLRIFDKFLLPISKFLDVGFCKFFGKNIFVLAEKNRIP